MRKEKPFFVAILVRPDIDNWEEVEDRQVVDWIQFNEDSDDFESVEGAVVSGQDMIWFLADAAKRGVFRPKYTYDDFIVQRIEDGDITAEYDNEGEPIWEGLD